MSEVKFKLGDKVVPFKKTADSRAERSTVFMNAVKICQYYLYVTSTPSFDEYQEYGLSDKNSHGYAIDFFHESDIIKLEDIINIKEQK